MEITENINYGIWQMLSRTRHLVYKARQKELKQYGISMQNTGILHTIIRLNDQVTLGRIAQETFLEPHTVSSAISRMSVGGLVNKVNDLERKNMVRIEITEKGYEVYRNSARRKAINDIMSTLTQKEKPKLWSLLVKIRSKAMKQLEIECEDDYPPSDYFSLYSNNNIKVTEDIYYGLWLMLSRTRHLVFKARQKELTQYGISMRNAGILHTIIRLNDQVTLGRIAQETFLEPHTVSAVISKMETKELIKKVKDLEKKNMVRLEVAEKGYEVYQNSTRRKSIDGIMSTLTQKEKHELWSLLGKIRSKAMEQLGIECEDDYPRLDYIEL
ncbi:MarR family winged helix-turn-helix transcriptional regulator [Chloroflexota bacterium]